jgi:hypothetical protein
MICNWPESGPQAKDGAIPAAGAHSFADVLDCTYPAIGNPDHEVAIGRVSAEP